jgi:hypothetical protein
MAKENDIVLIYYEDQPITFARIENITPDIKKDWYNVKLLMLQVPLQVTTWILRDIYINGQEFTMDGKKMRLEQVVCPEDTFSPEKNNDVPGKPNGKKIISLADLKNK